MTIKYVYTWPKKIKIDNKIIIRPTEETCRKYGYELYTEEMIEEMQRLIEDEGNEYDESI